MFGPLMSAESAPSSPNQSSASATSTVTGMKRWVPELMRGKHFWTWIAIAKICALVPLLMMSWAVPARATTAWVALFGVLGSAFAFAKAFGLVEWLPAKEKVAIDLKWNSPWVAVLVSGAIFLIGAAAFGTRGLPATLLLALLVLLPASMNNPGLLVFTIASVILLPCLGVYGLWDPWETHYGEVAREILSRNDWISLWWAHEEWFWSKPILIFWTEALSILLTGFPYQPDQVLPHHIEWAVRLPHYLMATFAVVVVYHVIKRRFSTMAGVFASLVVVTLPHYFMLSHQAITDMPFVSNMTMATSLLAFAFTADPFQQVKSWTFWRLRMNATTAVVFGLFVLALPQILYLLSRNVSWSSEGVFFSMDHFSFGSAGNAGNPGQPAAREMGPVFIFEPALQATLWSTLLFFVVMSIYKERRVQTLAMYGFYLFAALAFMGKGIPGFALPGLVALIYLIVSKRWDLLLLGRIRVATGAAIVATVGLPWFVAMYVRHGRGFTDRLLVHDHINRLTVGVHQDETRLGSIGYFLDQLGVGLYPWIAFLPIGAGIWLYLARRKRTLAAGEEYRQAVVTDDAPASSLGRSVGEREAALVLPETDQKQHMLWFYGLWATSAFVLFSAMSTKFHHYIFPVVPPTGVLIGIALARLLERTAAADGKRAVILGTVLSGLAGAVLVIAVGGLFGDLRGVIPASVRGSDIATWARSNAWSPGISYGLIGVSIALFVTASWLFLPKDEKLSWKSLLRGSRTPKIAGALLIAPVVVAFIGRDLAWVTDARPYGYERLIHLFVYNYERRWPEQFDYRPILSGFAVAAALVAGLAAFDKLRHAAVRAFFGVAMAFAVWSLDVYLVDLSPHWSQRNVFERYYERRTGPEEPVIAYQMNWKGENLYTGNRVYIFVDLDNRRLNEWVRAHRGQRVFIAVEHSRAGSVRAQLGGAQVTEETTMRENNKFQLLSATIPAGPAPAAQAVPRTRAAAPAVPR